MTYNVFCGTLSLTQSINTDKRNTHRVMMVRLTIINECSHT